jgi:hypothetical protein
MEVTKLLVSVPKAGAMGLGIPLGVAETHHVDLEAGSRTRTAWRMSMAALDEEVRMHMEP